MARFSAASVVSVALLLQSCLALPFALNGIDQSDLDRVHYHPKAKYGGPQKTGGVSATAFTVTAGSASPTFDRKC